MYKTRRRDRIAIPVINFALKVLTTKDYRTFIEGAIIYGLDSAARDQAYNLPLPPPWQTWACEDCANGV